MTVAEKIANIESNIKRHEYNFFVLGENTISRPELDILKVELYNLKNMKTAEPLQSSSANPASEPDIKEDSFKFFDGI